LKLKFFLVVLTFFFFCLLLGSCSDKQSDQSSQKDNTTAGFVETATGVTLNFSDLGLSKLKLKAPVLIKSESDQLIMECPEGLELTFYDSLENIESVLIADYGKLFSKKELLKVRDNVEFYNYKKDTLFAEELIIDFAKDSIFSEKLVTFSNEEGRISGKKLKANSNFTFFQLSDISESHVNYDF